MLNDDVYNIWDGSRFRFTLNKLAAISNGLMVIPDCYKSIADEPIEILTSVMPPKTEKLTVRWIPLFEKSQIKAYRELIYDGIIVVSHYEFKDQEGRPLPLIKMDSYEHVRNVWCMIGAYMKRVFEMPTISVTASIGKTTTVLFMESIFGQRKKVYVSGRNRNNSEPIVQQMLQTYGPEYGYHVQEVGGGAPRVVERSAELLNSDAFCIGNILPHHLDRYKTMEGIEYDKTSFDRMGEKDIFGVINIDDDRLRNHPFKNRIVTCGIKHTEANYVAKNIRQDGIWLRMDIVHRDECVPISINIPGAHNAYNAVLAFAMAKEWGLTNEEIQAGFRAYKSGAIRQNLREIAGRIMYIDCFNTNRESIKSCLQTLDTIEPKNGGRRIAILSGENALGKEAYSINYELGQECAQYHADEFIFVGISPNSTLEEWDYCGHSYAFYEGAKGVIRDRPVTFYEGIEAVADKLVQETKPGDVILFKGHFKLAFWPILDRAFGTSFSAREVVSLPMYRGVLWRNKSFASRYYVHANGSNITQCLHNAKNVQIPNAIIGKPVARVGTGLFARREDLESVEFGMAVKNLGEKSFLGCKGLKKLDVPSNVIYVEKEAFAGCTELEEVSFSGVLHLEKGVFRNCEKLKRIYFTESCQTIEEGVFEGCGNVTVIAPEGSVAHAYAVENGLNFESTKSIN